MRSVLVLSALLTASFASAEAPRSLTTLRPGTYSVTRDVSHANLSSKTVKGGNARFTLHGDRMTLGAGHGYLEGTVVQLRPITRAITTNGKPRSTITRYVGTTETFKNSARTTVEVSLSPHTYRGYHAGLKEVAIHSITERGPTGPGFSSQSGGAAFRIAGETK